MISDRKIAKWCELISADDSPLVLDLGIEEGTRWQTHPPYPELIARSNEHVQVRRFVVQSLVLTASVPEDHDQADIAVQRLVAELENGQQLEIMRTASQAKNSDIVVDPSICNSCGQGIADELDTGWFDNKPYHKRCLS